MCDVRGCLEKKIVAKVAFDKSVFILKRKTATATLVDLTFESLNDFKRLTKLFLFQTKKTT